MGTPAVGGQHLQMFSGSYCRVFARLVRNPYLLTEPKNDSEFFVHILYVVFLWLFQLFSF